MNSALPFFEVCFLAFANGLPRKFSGKGLVPDLLTASPARKPERV